jgi:hypothetical protein
MDLKIILAIISNITILVPQAKDLVAMVLSWFKETHPEISNDELIASLRAHGLANVAGIDAWIAAHPPTA